MNQLSNPKKLGVIVLAATYLGNLNLRRTRPISAAARLLGVSRKTGYAAARRIEHELGDCPAEDRAQKALEQEVLLLRIKNQVLTYERDHPGVRFGAKGAHLPAEARSLCVRLLRDFRGTLSACDIAAAIGVPSSSLSRWDAQADPECRFPEPPERRGRHRHATALDADQVAQAFKDLTRDMTLEEFATHYNALHPACPLDRRTITRILRAGGLYKQGSSRQRTAAYHGRFKVYFPGAQVAVDGKETTVRFTGAPHERVTVVKEVAVDIASEAIVGEVLTAHENAAAVKGVVVKAKKECESLLAILADNRSSNTAPEAQCVMQEHSALGPIFTFPYHARTNGHLEGLFGQFSRIVGAIEIDDSSRTSLAQSLVDVVWRIFIHFHNHAPRRRLGGHSPLQYLRTYTVRPQEVQKARSELHDQQRRSRHSRRPNPRLCDRAFRALVARILATHGFTDVALERAVQSLVRFDTSVIESASSAFSAQSQREGFEERKRHFAYFIGIARNKQRALDAQRSNAAADVLRAARLFDEHTAHAQQLAEEKRQEARELATQPEAVIVRYAQRLMQGHFRWMRRTSLARIREGLAALRCLGKTTTQILATLALSVRALPDFAEDVRERMVHVLSEELQQLPES